MDYHFLLQGIFLIQGSNPHLLCLLHLQAGLLPLAPPGKHKHKKDWLKDVLCSSVFFRKIFEIIKNLHVNVFHHCLQYFKPRCIHAHPTVLSLCLYIWLAVTNERTANFMEVQVQGSNCMFPLSRLILYVLLEHFFDSTLSQIFVTTMGTSPR